MSPPDGTAPAWTTVPNGPRLESLTHDGLRLGIGPVRDDGTRHVYAAGDRRVAAGRWARVTMECFCAAGLDECTALAADLADEARRMLAAGGA